NYRARIALAQFYLDPQHSNLVVANTQAAEALKLDQTRIDAYSVQAQIRADRGEWNELNLVMMAATANVPDDPAPYYRAAERLIANGRDNARAERYLRFYLGQEPEGNEPSLSDTHWKLGLVLRSQGRAAEASQEWREAVRLDPESKAAA